MTCGSFVTLPVTRRLQSNIRKPEASLDKSMEPLFCLLLHHRPLNESCFIVHDASSMQPGNLSSRNG